MTTQTRYAALAVLAICGGCSSIKEYIPIHIDSVALRVPNQQRIISEAAITAVNQAAAAQEANLAQLSGHSVLVEVDGVFPHTQTDLLGYLRSAVEGELARRGARVLPKPAAPEVRSEISGGEGSRVSMNLQANAEATKPDARVVASVDWGGIDFQDNKHASSGRVAGMVVVGLFTFGVGAIIWALAQSPMVHTFTLKARVHVTLRTIPSASGLRFAMASGAGESQITIDAETDSGYTNNMSVPQKKE